MERDERLCDHGQDMPGQQGSIETFDSEDRAEALMTMIEIHGEEVDPEKVEQYLAVLHRMRRRKGRCRASGRSQGHI